MSADDSKSAILTSSTLRQAGIAFALLFVAALIVLGELLGSFGDGAGVFVDHYDEPGLRTLDIVGAYLLAFSLLAFILFVGGITNIWATSADLRSPTRLVWACCLLFVGAALVAAALLSTFAFSFAIAGVFDEEPKSYSGADLSILPELGYVLLLGFAPLPAAVAVAAISVTELQHRRLPRVLAFAGLLVAVLLPFGILFLPLFALPLWVLAVSAFLLLRGGTREPGGEDRQTKNVLQNAG